MLGQPSCEQQDLEVAPCICFAHNRNWVACKKNIQAKSNISNNKDSRLQEQAIEIGHRSYNFKHKTLLSNNTAEIHF